MMKKYLLLSFLLCCVSLNLFASKKDSLWTVWEDTTQLEATRLSASYKLLTQYYIYQNVDTAAALLKKQIALAEKSNDNAWLGRLYNAKGVFLSYKGEVNNTIKAYNQAVIHYNIVGDTSNVIATSFNLAADYISLNQLDEAIALLDTLAPIIENIGKTKFKINHAFLSGTCYHLKDDFFKALAQYKICETIVADTTFNRKNVNDPYTNIGAIYDQLNMLDLAESYYRKSIAYNEVYTTEKYGVITSNNALGELLIKKGKTEEGKQYLKKSIQIAEENPDFLPLKIEPLVSYSQLLVNEKNPMANQYINELIEVSQAAGYKDQEKLGTIFKGLYFLNQKQFNSAIQWCKNGIDTTFNIRLQHRIYACDCLYQAHKKLGRFDKALSYLELNGIYSDSLLNEKNVQEATTMELKYQFDEQNLQDSIAYEKELFALEKDKDILAIQNKNYLLSTLGIGLLALTILGFLLNLRRKNQQITQQKLALEQLNITKDRLFAIISHDLRKPALAFRGISKKVKFLIRQQDFKTLDQYGASIEKAAFSLNSLLDNLLNWALQQRAVLPYKPMSIKVEEVTQEIFDLFEQMAADKNIALEMDIPVSTTIFADLNAYTTIVRNLIDNAIKYTPNGGLVKLSTAEVAEGIAFKIADTGKGIADSQVPHLFELQQNKSQQGTGGEMGTGLGLVIVKDLVALNKGIISVESKTNEGTTFKVILPAA